jgi:hypothetical protein
MEIKASGDLGGRGLGYSCSYSLPGGGGGVVRAAARGTGDAAANAAVAARAVRPRGKLAAAGRGHGSVRGCGEGSGEHRRDHSRRHGVRGLGREWVGGLREGISGRKKWKGGAVAAVAVVVVAV